MLSSSILDQVPEYAPYMKMLLRPKHECRLDEMYYQSRKVNGYFMNISLFRRHNYDDIYTSSKVKVPCELIRPGNMKIGRIKNLIVTTKAPDVVKATKVVLPYLEKKSKIVLLCNGALAVREELISALKVAGIYSEVNIILGSITHGSHQDVSRIKDSSKDERSSYNVVHAGNGNLYVESQSIASVFQLSDSLSCEYTSSKEMEDILWDKLAANCVINPLTALFRCNNGDILQHENSRSTLQSILKEVSEVATRHRKEAFGLDDERFSYDRLNNFVENVINLTANNKSSMLQDIENCRSTEIEYLNGFVCKLGRKYGIPTLKNDELRESVSDLLTTGSQDVDR